MKKALYPLVGVGLLLAALFGLGSSSAAPNLISNGEFATNVSGWTLQNGAVLTFDATRDVDNSASSGSGHVTNGGAFNDVWVVSGCVSLSPGTHVFGATMAVTQNGIGTVESFARLRPCGGGAPLAPDTAQVAVGTFQSVSSSFTGSGSVELMVFFGSTNSSIEGWFDRAFIADGPLDTPTPTPTRTPAPASVGGIAEQPNVPTLPSAAASSDRSDTIYILLAVVLFAAITAGIWVTWRKRIVG